MKAKLHYVLSTTMVLFAFSVFGQQNLFTKTTSQNITRKKNNSKLNETNQIKIYNFNYNDLNNALSKTSNKSSTSKNSDLIISFPNENDEFENYHIREASVMHPDIQAKYPEIRSYVGYSVNSSSNIRLSLSPYKGLNAVILGKEKTTIIQPTSKNINQISVQTKSDLLKGDTFKCNALKDKLFKKVLETSGIKNADDSNNRKYRLALSVTNEYAIINGNTLASVNAALVATLTNINSVFENDLNITLELIATNDNIIYLGSTTDPYSTLANYNTELASNLDTIILEANYDIGHLLGGIDDSSGDPTGDAGCIGCVCNNGGSAFTEDHKGSAFTTGTNPNGFNFDIDFVAHEIGHQFGANHTWTHDGNEGNDTQMEPASGSTIMGYAGITEANVQPHSSPYFHAISIEQITTYIKGTSCATITNTGNTTPIVSAGADLTLPIGTPFKLVGTGNDADGDIITFCWEQINENNAATIYPDPNSGASNSVLYRSFPPSTNNTRIFPNLSDLRYGVNSTPWEKIPNTARTADFRLTVRDNKAGGANNNHDDMTVTFNNSYGPFEITSQNTSNILLNNGNSETITWAVNNTNNLPGASNVNILLSIDGGLNYNQVIAVNVPNNGSYTFTVPSTPAPYCRIMIEPTNNNFFAINTQNFAIDYMVNTVCNQYDSASNLGIPIADNTGSFTQDHVINIAPSSTITDINIGVNITHDYIGDLAVAVTSPNATQVLLKSPADCGFQDHLITTFNDQAPEFDCIKSSINADFKSISELLSNLNGENSSGDWTINLGDYGFGDAGTLNSWFVEICETVETPLPIDELIFNNLQIFPNPNNGEFTISLKNSQSKPIYIEVYDVRGRSIFKEKHKNNGNFSESINLNHAQSGLYILNVSDGIKKVSKKIIIK